IHPAKELSIVPGPTSIVRIKSDVYMGDPSVVSVVMDVEQYVRRTTGPGMGSRRTSLIEVIVHCHINVPPACERVVIVAIDRDGYGAGLSIHAIDPVASSWVIFIV